MNDSSDVTRTPLQGGQAGDADLAGPAFHRAEPARVAFHRPLRWILAALFGAATFLFLGGVIATSGLERLALGAAAGAAGFLMIRAARIGIVAEPGQLVVRNALRTRKIAWPQIARFEMPPPYGAVRKTGIRIHLQDGRVISAKAYASTGIDQFVDMTTRPAQRVIEELSRLQRERGSARKAG